MRLDIQHNNEYIDKYATVTYEEVCMVVVLHWGEQGFVIHLPDYLKCVLVSIGTIGVSWCIVVYSGVLVNA